MESSDLGLRQVDLLPLGEIRRASIAIVGAGYMGSWVALALAKMGVRALSVFDGDVVEAHNVANQLYTVKDIGVKKVTALAAALRVLGSGTRVFPHDRIVDPYPISADILISAVDSMTSRCIVRECLSFNQDGMPLLIDIRAGAEEVRIITCPVTSVECLKAYDATLHTDAEGIDLPCTGRAIVYTGFFVAAVVAALVKEHIKVGVKEYRELAAHIPTLDVMQSRG